MKACLDKHRCAALLIIGNEILSGRTREANAWLAARELFARGCRLREIAVVPDERDAIISTLRRLREDADAVITSGGIGPTHDDITMECVAEALGLELCEFKDVLRQMRACYGENGLNAGRRRMARLPRGSRMIVCEQSIAPGAQVENVYVLAGVPEIFASQLSVILDEFGDAPFLREEIVVHLAESRFSESLARLQAEHPEVEIGSYPSRCGPRPVGRICLTARSQMDLERVRQAVMAMLARISSEDTEVYTQRGEKQ